MAGVGVGAQLGGGCSCARYMNNSYKSKALLKIVFSVRVFNDQFLYCQN